MSENKRQEIYDLVKNNNYINNNLIYDYIIKNNIKYTLNNNGLFVNLTRLNNENIDKLHNYITKMVFDISNREIDISIIKEVDVDKPQKIYKPFPKFTDIQNNILELSKTI